MKRQLTRMDWVKTAIDLMVDSSVDSVTVNRLTRALHTTKGSFYWHFESRDDLLNAIILLWQQSATFDVEIRLSRAEPTDQLLQLLRLPLKSKNALRAADLELAIVAWARRSQVVREAVARVDQHRISHITSLLLRVGVPEGEATFRAHLAYGFIRYVSQRRDMEVGERLRLTGQLYAWVADPKAGELPTALSSTIRKRKAERPTG